jgi:hypothetical protein
MKTIALIMLTIALGTDAAEAAGWLLWKHSFVTHRIEGAPRGLSQEGNVDKWELLNAVDLRKECIGALKVEQKKIHDGLVSTHPGEPISQSNVADGVGATLSAGAERKDGAVAKTTQLYYEFTLWCLPAAVDPRWTRPTPQRK